MSKISRRDALIVMGAPACAAAAQNAGATLPHGVRPVWDLEHAYRESTPTRERVCINGLWRWQPAGASPETIPAGGWGHLRVPESWPGGAQRWVGTTLHFKHPDWANTDLATVTAAWQQREITIPREWAGRRITLQAPYLNSYAAVYIDGRKIGEMRYPAGEIDVTNSCRPGDTHILTLHVLALPLKGVMLSFNDTASARQVEGRVARRGLCGDVWLSATPAAERISDVKIETSVRRWQLTYQAALADLKPGALYRLLAVVKDAGREVERYLSTTFAVTDLKDSRIAITERWRPRKLWDIHQPNQYDLDLALVDAGSAVLDQALPVRFGFREFWIEGRDFYLNGSRIYLSAIPLDNGQVSPASASYDGTRATLQRYKSFGINFVYTHNYGCEPGSHVSFEEVLRAADDEGMLVSFSQPHFGHYDWTASDADSTNGYAAHAEFYVRIAQNHPSVVCYSTSHNSTGYSEDMNPDMIDGIQNPRDPWALRNASRAFRAEQIIRRLDPSRFVYHHSSGNLGTMHTINFYANWAPAQEMSEWFEHWAAIGVKPVFTCEYSVPFLWDWAMYRGWYKGKREFGSAVAPWEFCLAEWNAQFLGDRAYKIPEQDKENIRWEAEQFRKGRAWQRFDYPHNLNTQVFDERFRIVAMHLTDNFRSFRTLGMSATSPWEYGIYWKPPYYERGPGDLNLEVDWENLQRPGARPTYKDERKAAAKLAFDRAAAEATPAAESLYRNNMPLLAYLAGKPAAFTSKDHNFLPGETFQKQLIVINNSRLTMAAECEWSSDLPGSTPGAGKITLATGEQKRIPLDFSLPGKLKPGPYEIRSRVRFSDGATQQDTFALTVMPPPAAPRPRGRIALFDPAGDTGKLLSSLGIEAIAVEAGTDLSSFDTLVIGKGALTLLTPAPDVTRVRDGLKVIVFEQTGEVLEKRFGFRIAEYGMRWVFRRVPDHPILSGLGEQHLRDWRGEATILPPRLTYERAKQFNYVPTVKWAGITVPRLWRCGNRGNVASAVIEKPACGDFLPLLDCGYNLQYSSLLEYREGKGIVLLCQTDVSGRTEPEPAAETLVRNLFAYVDARTPDAPRQVVYAGDSAGRRYLESAGWAPLSYPPGGLSSHHVLAAGPGAKRDLQAHAASIAKWLRSGGGRLAAIALDGEEASVLLAAAIKTTASEHIAAYFEPCALASPLAGVSPAEVHNRDPRLVPLISNGATVVGNGVLAHTLQGNAVFSQLAPWQFDYSGEKMNVKRTFRRVACLTARLLGNMNAAGNTPLLERISKPVGAGEQRWLKGLYLDIPEEWDDPYRFFRW